MVRISASYLLADISSINPHNDSGKAAASTPVSPGGRPSCLWGALPRGPGCSLCSLGGLPEENELHFGKKTFGWAEVCRHGQEARREPSRGSLRPHGGWVPVHPTSGEGGFWGSTPQRPVGLPPSLLLLFEARTPLEASAPAPQTLHGRSNPVSPRPPSRPQPRPPQPPSRWARTCPSPGPMDDSGSRSRRVGRREAGCQGWRWEVGGGGRQTVATASPRRPAEQSFPSRACLLALPGLLAPSGRP